MKYSIERLTEAADLIADAVRALDKVQNLPWPNEGKRDQHVAFAYKGIKKEVLILGNTLETSLFEDEE